MIAPLLILAACPAPIAESRFTAGQRSALRVTDAGLAVDMTGPGTQAPDAGLAGLPGSVFGLYVSPVYDVGDLARSAELRFTCAGQCGRPLPDDGGVETDPGGADMTGNVLLYHFDETWSGVRGEVRDASGLGHHGTVDGGLGATVPGGLFGRAAQLNGDQCIVVPDGPSLDPSGAVTLAAWFRLRALSGAPQGLFAKRVDYLLPSAYTFYVHSGDQLWVDVDTENDRFFGSAMMQAGRWTHAAMVFDGSRPAAQRVLIYVDGALDSTGLEASSVIPDNDGPLSVGCLHNPALGLRQGLDGLIDEAAVWHRALSAEEISGLYERGRDRVLVQARACPDATCSGDPVWSQFFVTAGGPLQLPDSRYFQFRAWLENFVVLSSVSIDVQCAEPDAGAAPADAGPQPGPELRSLGVQCGCSSSAPCLVLVLALPGLRRRRPHFC